MLKVSASEFQRDIGHYQDLAVHEPIALTDDGRESCVLISTEEYRRLKRRDCEAVGVEEFSDFDADAVQRAQAPTETAAFNHELD